MSSKFALRADGYADSLLAGRIPSCEMVKLAARRWKKDLERDDLYWDEKAFVKVCRFSQMLKHFKGEYAGRAIKLEDWQLFVIANIFGIKRKSNRRRKYTYADVYVPRKNGKTTLAAIIALYMLLLDGESAAEVYAAAVDKAQAMICFEAARELIKTNPALVQAVQIYRGSIVFPQNASSFKPLSKDTKNKDGLNPSAAVCDERHAWKTNEIFDVIKTGMGARPQPLVFSISTAGTDTSNPYFRDLGYLRDIMLGVQEDDNHFILLYEPDKDDKWDDELTWRKVNPNYGISLYPEYMQNEFKDAKQKGGTTLAAFQTKNLNMWVDAPEVWIPDDDVAANNALFDESKLHDADCYIGIDYSAKTDIVAVAFYFPAYNVVKYWMSIPEAKKEKHDDRVDYRKWVEDGWFEICPGSVIDDGWFLSRLFYHLKNYKIKCIAFDPWGMWQIKTKFGYYEDVALEWDQDIRHMSVPTKRVEYDILQHKLNFLGNPVIRWMFRNVVVYIDPNANIKLDKARSRNKIDGVVALVDAIGGYLQITGGDTAKPYMNHDLRLLRI